MFVFSGKPAAEFFKISLNLANIYVLIKLSIIDSKLLRTQIQWHKLANTELFGCYTNVKRKIDSPFSAKFGTVEDAERAVEAPELEWSETPGDAERDDFDPLETICWFEK